MDDELRSHFTPKRQPRAIGPQVAVCDKLHLSKYRSNREPFRERMNAVAAAMTDSTEHYHAFREALLEQRILPAGRIQNAMGSSKWVTPFNCFVSGPVQDTFVGHGGWGDDTGSIMRRAWEGAATMRMGGGMGYDFSGLRPRGELIRKLGSRTCGVVGFLPIYSEMCLATASTGDRRGAQMGCLRVDHPDIEDFIACKQNSDKLRGFNLSILITDKFMQAVIDDKEFNLVWGGKEYRTVPARALWEKIMRSTWDWAEPGVIFIDRINDLNNLHYCETISATNPCFAAGTLIVTDKGAFPIEQLVGRSVNVYDGFSWRSVDNFRITGHNQPMVKITMQDGSTLRVTKQHDMLLANGERKKATSLSVFDELMLSNIEYEGDIVERGAYLKGFLLGDGALKRDYAELWLYEPKYMCQERLTESLADIPSGSVNTNAVEVCEFKYAKQNCRRMTGLTPKKDELSDWVSTYREGLPQRAFAWTLRSRLDFIAGLMDSDGTVLDTTNGYGYQISLTNERVLLDLQILLKSVGVRSKVTLMRGAGHDHWGDHKPVWRLSIAQAAAIYLSSQIKFERLCSFADKQSIYNVKSRSGIVTAVESDGVDSVVYCCTVPTTHSVSLAIGLVTGQCSEQPLPPYGACLLGSVNLPAYLVPTGEMTPLGPRYTIDLELLRADIPNTVRAFDLVNDRAQFPLPQQREEALNKRRMGIGVTGLANAIEALGFEYGSDRFLSLEDSILRFINVEAYTASARLSAEKGCFPLFDKDKYLCGKFTQTLPSVVRDLIADHGIRNSHLTSIAPTGTIALCADNVSSGIEPVYMHKQRRIIQTFEGPIEVELEDYGVRALGVRGKQCEDVTIVQHIAVQACAQKHIDSAISKTCNVPATMAWEDFKNVYLDAYQQGCKSVSTFTTGGKRTGILSAVAHEDEEPDLTCRIDDSGIRSCE